MIKYRFNTKTLKYERLDKDIRYKYLNYSKFFVSSLVVGACLYFIFSFVFKSPQVINLNKEISQLEKQYALLNTKADQTIQLFSSIQNRDDSLYRSILNSRPIPQSIREAGFGGTNRYENLEGYNYTEITKSTAVKLDKLINQLYIEKNSQNELIILANKRRTDLTNLPAIQPISNKSLTRIASGFGIRIHPILRIRKMHAGMDFTASTGTEIFATGGGEIIKVSKSKRGYGQHIIIDHKNGFQTLYAHLHEMNVSVGQKVKRGEVIATVGSTGFSTGPHLHYEVRHNKKAVNPVNFYFNELSPEEYTKIVNLPSLKNMPLD